MHETVTSLFWIFLCAVLAPVLAGLVPKRRLPEVVLLLGAGILIGPHALDLAGSDETIALLHDFGLGMLFLLAGYEIELGEVTGRGGRRALVTWLSCLAMAFAVVFVLDAAGIVTSEVAVAIALTSTALGTLIPILKDSNLMETAVGRTVLNHGAYGEVGPVIAMAVLLSATGPVGSIVALSIFLAIAVAAALLPARARDRASRVVDIVRAGSETTAQTTVRFTVLLLFTLGTLAAAFHLDSILGAFAAGFVLRQIFPSGDERLETKLEGLAFGLLIPLFFITSGMDIDMDEVVSAPGVLVVFVLGILLVRGVPVLIDAWTDRDPETGLRRFTPSQSLQVGLYGATGLPVIVAVTTVAVESDAMSKTAASILVTGGALTVAVLPFLAGVLGERERAGRDPAADQPEP
ncbi:Kef-type K+ transport system membrane component KefB [Mumia flava]|uniref:Kef-type K+ transport system membrane component KefB n=1 Tax=Mumia flava TaxID=1348852 RepID=A0A0B2AWF9_9ACTN|nr:cation:proton antiporter [Mumia flava]PJJ56688.1 Kef-type K+ transport system membrane component KefB [Mumia flava]